MRPSILLVSSLALFTIGCDEASAFLPGVNFSNLDVKSIDWELVDSDFVFEVDNPNPVSISVARFDYALAFEGIEWINGDNGEGLALTALDSSEWALPVSIDFPSLYDTIQAIRGEDNVDFELQGSFGFDTSVGPIDIPYHTDGDFPALRMPEISLHALQAAPVDWSSFTVDMALELEIDNEHASTLSFFNMDYGISMAGSEITNGFLASLGDADGAKTTRLALPFSVDLLNIGTAAYDIIVGGDSAAVALTSTMEVDTPFEMIPLSIQVSQENMQIQ